MVDEGLESVAFELVCTCLVVGMKVKVEGDVDILVIIGLNVLFADDVGCVVVSTTFEEYVVDEGLESGSGELLSTCVVVEIVEREEGDVDIFVVVGLNVLFVDVECVVVPTAFEEYVVDEGLEGVAGELVSTCVVVGMEGTVDGNVAILVVSGLNVPFVDEVGCVVPLESIVDNFVTACVVVGMVDAVDDNVDNRVVVCFIVLLVDDIEFTGPAVFVEFVVDSGLENFVNEFVIS